MPHILYCIEVISGTIGREFNHFNRIFNRIVRFVYNVGYRQHITPYVQTFLGCSFYNYVVFRLLFFFHKVKHNGFPKYLVDNFHLNNSDRNPQFLYPVFHSTFFERSFQMRLSRMWNFLPRDLKSFSFSPQVFRRKLMLYLSFNGL